MASPAIELKIEPKAIDLETTSLSPEKARILGVGHYDGEITSFLPVGKLNREDSVSGWPFLVLHNGKYDARVLRKAAGIPIDVWWDTMVAEYLLHIDQPKKLEDVVKRRFGVSKKDLLQIFNEAQKEAGLNTRASLPNYWWVDRWRKAGKKLKKVHAGLDKGTLTRYGMEDVEYTYLIQQEQTREFGDRMNLYEWFKSVEMPLVNILVNTEHQGMRLNLNSVKKLTGELSEEVDNLEARLRKLAGIDDLNLNSSKQLKEVLYKKFKLPVIKETKTGPSTDKSVMELLAKRHLFPKLMLDYKERRSMLDKFLMPLPDLADERGYVHPNFNQCGTRTRRFSCNNPNIQQIPKRSKLGKRVRSCFVASEGCSFIQADYSQIELRLLAHFSEDPNLLKWFREGVDVHERTAELLSKRLGRNLSRDVGKTINFSLLYGKTAYGFAKDWNTTEEEAEEVLDAYFKELPGVRRYIEKDKIRLMKNRGWTKTVCDLPIYVGKVSGISDAAKARVLRQGVNARIQGSSQDILKKATVNIARREGLYPCCLVHDMLMYDVRNSYVERSKDAIKREMETAIKLKVPTPVDVEVSREWN